MNPYMESPSATALCPAPGCPTPDVPVVHGSYSWIDDMADPERTVSREPMHAVCAFRVKARLAKQREIVILTEAIVEACKQSPLKELIESLTRRAP